MNLSEERNYLKLQETLDALGLTEKNRALAEAYLDTAQPENRELLKEVEHQDFSQINQEQRKKSIDYVNHCEKRKKEDELGRYIRFVAEAGGSTAFYPLAYYSWSLSNLESYLSLEQQAAIGTESCAWSAYSLTYQSLRKFFGMGGKNPDILARARKLCYHQYGNGKVLLSGIYLGCVKPESSGGLLKKIFGKNEQTQVMEAAEDIAFEIGDSYQALFQGTALSGEENEKLLAFLENDSQMGPLPESIMEILRAHTFPSYLLTLFTCAAFLGMAHSAKLRAYMRMFLAADSRVSLEACRELDGAPGYKQQIKLLEEIYPGSRMEYLQWCIKEKRAEAVRRMAKSEPETIRQGVAQTTAEGYAFLMEAIKLTSPILYQELSASYAEQFREKAAAGLVKHFSVGQTEAKRYLLGEEEIESIYLFADAWRKESAYDYQHFRLIEDMQKKEPQLFERALILEALRLQGYIFTNKVLKQSGNRWKNIDKIIESFEKERMPLSYQLEAYEAMYGAIYTEDKKAALLDGIVENLTRKWDRYAEELRLQARNSTAVGRFICIGVMDHFWEQEKETLLACAVDSSKMVRELLVLIYAEHKEWEQEISALLSSKKSQERETAVLVLKKWGAAQYQQKFAEALEKEKSKKLQELLKECLGVTGEAATEADGGVKTPEKLAAEILKGGKKRKVFWIFETPGTEVLAKNGSEAPEEYLQALLVSYADMTIPGFCQDAKVLAEELDPVSLADFMAELFDKWLEGNAEAKKKWVLYAASIHGGQKIVPAIHHQIQEWPQHSRGAIAAEAVKALALNGSPEALLLVDNISRKFKFRQVKTAAGEALSYAAEQMGISKAELEDKIVPNLGFGEDLSQTFDYGTRTFTVYLTPALELEVFDKEQKRLKTLPAPGKRDEEEKAAKAYAEFKQLKKQLKVVVTNQKLRLEQALTAERLWKTEQWEALFVKNPVMHQFAIGLIWGIYENGELKDTFRYMEDGSFNTVDEDEYELPAEGQIGLVHPIELEEETLAAWKEQLSDYEVEQPILQLERDVFEMTEEEQGAKELTRFGGKILNGLSLSGKLQGMGWYRGSVQDGGVYNTFYREDGDVGVELEFSGSFVGDENEDVTVYGASFYKAGTVKRGSYVYDTIKDKNRYLLGEVNERYFSEIILQLAKATASSQEQLAYPECKQ